MQHGLLVLSAGLEMGPGLAPDRPQVARGRLEPDRSGIASDVFVEGVQVVLRILEPGDQVKRLGAVAHGEGEHLEARLAALKRVAALVRQPGDDLPDGGQSLGLEGPLLGLLEERDVVRRP